MQFERLNKNQNSTVSEKRKKVWDCELLILKRFDDVCKKHNLTYFLEAGTLLGAIRHHGFIPWDDDIDVSMPRKDYDKLVEIGFQEFSAPYFFQYITTDKKYPGLHVKIRKSDTTAILNSWLFTDVNQGIFIDVFPLDGVPNDISERDSLFKKASLTGRALKSFYNYDKILSINPKIIVMLLKRRKQAKTLIKDQNEYVKKYKEYQNMFRKTDFDISDKVGLISFDYASGNSVVYDRADYSDSILVDFENMKLPAPIGYKNVLRTYFGEDYMIPKQLPSDHGSVYFDPDNSYKKYIPILRRQYSLLSRIYRVIKSMFTHNYLTKLERNLYKM